MGDEIDSSGLTPEQAARREEMKERGRALRREMEERHVDTNVATERQRETRDRADAWLREWLPNRIECGMEATGLTVKSLAKRAGFHSEATLRSKMRSGSFTFGDVWAIAIVFRVKLEWFISPDPFPESEADYWHRENRPPAMRIQTLM